MGLGIPAGASTLVLTGARYLELPRVDQDANHWLRDANHPSSGRPLLISGGGDLAIVDGQKYLWLSEANFAKSNISLGMRAAGIRLEKTGQQILGHWPHIPRSCPPYDAGSPTRTLHEVRLIWAKDSKPVYSLPRDCGRCARTLGAFATAAGFTGTGVFGARSEKGGLVAANLLEVAWPEKLRPGDWPSIWTAPKHEAIFRCYKDSINLATRLELDSSLGLGFWAGPDVGQAFVIAATWKIALTGQSFVHHWGYVVAASAGVYVTVENPGDKPDTWDCDWHIKMYAQGPFQSFAKNWRGTFVPNDAKLDASAYAVTVAACP